MLDLLLLDSRDCGFQGFVMDLSSLYWCVLGVLCGLDGDIDEESCGGRIVGTW